LLKTIATRAAANNQTAVRLRSISAIAPGDADNQGDVGCNDQPDGLTGEVRRIRIGGRKPASLGHHDRISTGSVPQ